MATDANKIATIDPNEQAVAWLKYFKVWRSFHWASLVAISGGSALVASKWADVYLGSGVSVVAIVVAVVSATYASVQPNKQAEAYRMAWIALVTEIRKQNGWSDAMMNAMVRAEAIISGASPHDATPKAP